MKTEHAEFLPIPIPGEHLEELLDELELSRSELSQRTGIAASRISEIIKGRRAINAEYSMRLGRCFGQSEAFWYNLQCDTDFRLAQRQKSEQIEKEVQPLEVA